jgi:hypothetical protein
VWQLQGVQEEKGREELCGNCRVFRRNREQRISVASAWGSGGTGNIVVVWQLQHVQEEQGTAE